MATTSIVKDADETITYTIDCNDSLGSGETVSSVVVNDSPSGLTIGAPAISSSGTEFNIRISGGTTDVVYELDIVVTTSNSNILNLCLTLTIQSSCWMKEMVLMLRYLINDIDPQVYSDNRLAQVILLSAQYVQQELNWRRTYDINLATSTIEPDPAAPETRDVDFMNFVVLKAACFTDQSTARTKALAEGIRAQCGPASLSVSGNLDGFLKLLEVGPCGAYKQLRKEWLFGRLTIRAVFSPFVSNQFFPTDQQSYGEHRWI